MKYLFEDIEEQERLKIILEEWVGTPFRHHCGVKKLGTDCIHMVMGVLNEVGVEIDPSVVPDYPRDWHLHNTREILSEAIENYLSQEKVPLDNLVNGDIILSHYGKAASHVGIYFDGYVYQALNGIGVKKINFNDEKFKKGMKFAYRVMK